MSRRQLVSDEQMLEQALVDRDDTVHALPLAPARFEIEQNLFGDRRRLGFGRELVWRASAFPFFGAMRKDIIASMGSLGQNPPQPKTRVTPSHLAGFEALARSLGVGAIGYTSLPPEAVFRGKAVMYDHAIVLTMEMDPDRIADAPSRRTLRMVMKTYYELGRIITRLVDALRQDGCGAQAGHPLNGLALYPLIAQKAGLGWCGSHGLLITPEFGPRQRLGLIYTSIQNLPVSQSNEHQWVKDLCARCGQCLRKCPGQAILKEPVRRELGIVTHIDVDRCFPVFAEQYGCSICIKVCPFNRHPYERIKKAFLN